MGNPSYNFELNFEIICMSLHEPAGQMQFELFEKPKSANYSNFDI